MTTMKERAAADRKKRRAARWRGTLFEVREALSKPSNRVAHVLANDDGTYSIMRHINCEWCDFCAAEEKTRKHKLADVVAVRGVQTPDGRTWTIHPYKENPYEEQKKLDAVAEAEREAQRIRRE